MHNSGCGITSHDAASSTCNLNAGTRSLEFPLFSCELRRRIVWGERIEPGFIRCFARITAQKSLCILLNTNRLLALLHALVLQRLNSGLAAYRVAAIGILGDKCTYSYISCYLTSFPPTISLVPDNPLTLTLILACNLVVDSNRTHGRFETILYTGLLYRKSGKLQLIKP